MSDITILPVNFVWFIIFGLATCLIASVLVVLTLYGLARRASERRRAVAITTPWLPRSWWVGFTLFLANVMLTLLSATGTGGPGLPDAAALAWIPLNAVIWLFYWLRSRHSQR